MPAQIGREQQVVILVLIPSVFASRMGGIILHPAQIRGGVYGAWGECSHPRRWQSHSQYMGFVVSSSCLKGCCISSMVPLGPGLLSFLVSRDMYYGYRLGQVARCQESANLRQIFNLFPLCHQKPLLFIYRALSVHSAECISAVSVNSDSSSFCPL